MGFIEICNVDDLTEGEIKAFHTKSGAVALTIFKGEVYAFQETCTHADVSLEEGWVEDGIIECVAHGAKFRADTGEVLEMPATEDLETFPAQIKDGKVEVDLD